MRMPQEAYGGPWNANVAHNRDHPSSQMITQEIKASVQRHAIGMEFEALLQQRTRILLNDGPSPFSSKRSRDS